MPELLNYEQKKQPRWNAWRVLATAAVLAAGIATGFFLIRLARV